MSMPVETTEMRALRVGFAQTIVSLHNQADALRQQCEGLQAQNRELSGHVSDLLEMVQRLEAALSARAAA